MIEIKEVKIFPKSHYSLSKIITYVSVLIHETLHRVYLYRRETYEPGALIPFCHDPKIDVMAHVLSHQDK